MGAITADVRAVVEAAQLCFVATVTPDGRPNLSPKGTIRIWDDEHLFFLDIASPRTRANLAANQHVEVNVVDQLSRRGYRLAGRGTVHVGDMVFDEAMRRVFGAGPPRYVVHAVILIAVEHAEPVFSPGYLHIPTEPEMRRSWRKRRASADERFDAHVAAHPVSIPRDG